MSSGRPPAPARARRAIGFGAASGALAALAHAVAGGSLPSGWLLLVGAGLVAAASAGLLGREATWPRIVVALAAAQGALHVWLAVLGPHHQGTHAGDGSESGAGMLLAHAVATAAAATWLRYAEQRIWSAARSAWIRVLLARRRWLPDPPVLRRAAPARPDAQPVRDLISIHVRAALGVRGPPLLVGP